MQILQIAHCYYPPFLDCARQYAQLFKGTKYEVVTVYLTGKPNKEVEKATCSHEVIFLNYKSEEIRGLKLGAIGKIRSLVATRDFLFCITHRSKPTYIALLATNLPVVSVHHNYGDFDRFLRRVFINIFRKRLLLLGVSNSVRDEIRRNLSHWPAEKIQTLYNRIDVKAIQQALISKQEAREFLEIPNDKWVIANVGRLHKDKDQKTLLHAFKLAQSSLPKDTLLVIMGAGPLEFELKNLASNLGIQKNIIFTGNISNGRSYFKAFDLFALTSDHEPFGMVLLEAMAANLPIVCSNSGGGAEVIEGVGELFELSNPESLARSLIKISKTKSCSNLVAMKKKLDQQFSDEAARVFFRRLIKGFISIDY